MTMTEGYQMDILDLDMQDAAIQGTEKQWVPPSSFPDLTTQDRIFLAARSQNNLPLTFPETTGVEKPVTGGVIKKV